MPSLCAWRQSDCGPERPSVPPASTAALRAWADRLARRLLAPLPDVWYLRINFLLRTHRFLKLRNPHAYSDKIQWLMLYGKLERYAQYADKYEARQYIRDILGPEYLVPLIGIWDKFDDIAFDSLPDRFVLKATHGQGYNFFCADKSSLDVASLRRTVSAWTSENFYRREREPQYRPIRPRLIAEAYLQDESGELRDYKFPCFAGEPYLVQVLSGHASNRRENFFDRDWNSLAIVEKDFPPATEPIPKPSLLAEMFDVARKLAAGFPFVRVDLYCVDGQIYVGELTFTPACGLITYEPRAVDLELGRMLDLDRFVSVKPAHARHQTDRAWPTSSKSP
jgi:TupA-like ATPgrasp